MGLAVGIVGLPNVGKSTTFNALTKVASAQAANYPFCTIEPNRAIVGVPDPRINNLAKIVNPQKIVQSSIEFVDIAGLVKGASKGLSARAAWLCPSIRNLVNAPHSSTHAFTNSVKEKKLLPPQT